MMNNIVKNTSLYTIGIILPQIVGFLLLPIYTKYLSPGDYGIVSSMQVLSSILIIVFSFAIDRSIYRLYFDYKTDQDKRNYLGTITISLLFISSIILLLIFIFKGTISQIYKSIEFYPFFVFSIVSAFFSIFSIIPKIYFQINEKADKFIALSLLEFTLITGFVLWFIVVKQEGAIGMLKGGMIASIIISPLFLYISYKTVNFSFQIQILKDSLSFSLPILPSLLSAWILNLSDRIFIERYFTLYDVGIYSLGYKMAGIILAFSGAFNKAYNPVFYKLANSENQEKAKIILYKYNNIYIIVLIFVVFFVCIFSKEAILILLDPKYLESHKIIPIIAFAYLISQAGSLLNLSIYQEKKTLQIMYMIVASALLNIILNYMLVPIHGAYGAAYSTTLSVVFLVGLNYWYAKKCYFVPINWLQIIPITASLMLIFFIFHFINIQNIYLLLLSKLVVCGIIGLVFIKKYYPKIKNIINKS